MDTSKMLYFKYLLEPAYNCEYLCYVKSRSKNNFRVVRANLSKENGICNYANFIKCTSVYFGFIMTYVRYFVFNK